MPKFKPKDKPENMVLGYLQHRGAIGRSSAASLLDVWDLPAVICKLRKRGHKFTKKGKGKHLTYTLIKPKPEEAIS